MLLWCCVILRALGTRSRPVLVCALICLATPEQSKATAVVDGPSVMSILRMEGCRKHSLKNIVVSCVWEYYLLRPCQPALCWFNNWKRAEKCDSATLNLKHEPLGTRFQLSLRVLSNWCRPLLSHHNRALVRGETSGHSEKSE